MRLPLTPPTARRFHANRLAALPLLLAAATGAGGCVAGAGGRIDLWAVGPTQSVGPADPPRGESEYYSAQRNQIEIAGAANEVVSFQLALRDPGWGGRALIDFGAPAGSGGTLPVAGFRAYLQQSVTVRPLPGWYRRAFGSGASLDVQDVLIPLDSRELGGGVPLAGGSVTWLWIDYRIPHDARAGEYQAPLVVRGGDAELSRTLVVLRVWPFALPDTRNVSIIAALDAAALAGLPTGGRADVEAALGGALGDSARDAARLSIREACRLFHEHRLTPVVKHLYPQTRFAADGTLELDWSAFDETMGPLLDGSAYDDGLPPDWQPLPADRARPSPELFGGVAAPLYERMLEQYLQRCAAHFVERGWKARTFVDLTAPPPANPAAADYDRLLRLARMVRAAVPDAPALVNLHPAQMRQYGWPHHAFVDLGEAAGIWAPPAKFFDVPRMAAARGAGRRTWLHPDRPPFAGGVAIECTPIDLRCIGWHAFLQQSDVWLGDVSDWPRDVRPGAKLPPHVTSGFLAYPGRGADAGRLHPSRRLKLLLRAAQDFEYLWLLTQNGRAGAARLVAESLVTATGSQAYVDHHGDAASWSLVRDPQLWELARRVLAEELSEAVSGASVGVPTMTGGAFDERLNWTRLLAATRRVVAWRDGARLQWEPGGETPFLRAEFAVGFENHRRTPVSGALSLGPLPADWTADSATAALEPLAERSRTRLQVAVRMADAPVTPGGHVLQPLTFKPADGETIDIPALLSVVTPAAARRERIRIDGRLNDWALAPGNVAADFVRVGGDPPTPGGAAPLVRAADQTLAYVAADATDLYLGLRCLGNPPAGGDASRGNRVDYDDLMPAGGDEWIEVLFDPTNAGADSFDLYRLVFKRDGGLWAEQGVSLPQPIGRRRPWVMDVEYELTRDGEGWTVEARVPLASFGAKALRNRVWGLDFARFSARLGEYSNWSGAARYCFSPRALGNLYWRK